LKRTGFSAATITARLRAEAGQSPCGVCARVFLDFVRVGEIGADLQGVFELFFGHRVVAGLLTGVRHCAAAALTLAVQAG
jgi:hypothetical protein